MNEVIASVRAMSFFLRNLQLTVTYFEGGDHGRRKAFYLVGEYVVPSGHPVVWLFKPFEAINER